MMSFAGKIIETIKNPRNAMVEIAGRSAIKEAVLLAGTYAVLIALTAYLRSTKINVIFDGAGPLPPSSGMSIATIMTIISMLFPFFAWLASAGVLHMASKALGGNGIFPQTISILGYSMIPMILSASIGFAFLLVKDPLTITVSAINPTAGSNVVETYLKSYDLATSTVGIIMSIWMSIILFLGLRTVHGLTSVKSAVLAAMPLAIFIWSIWNFVRVII